MLIMGSGNCVTVDKPCEYPIAVLPLREKRKKCLPGEQQPWKPADGAVMTMTQALGPCISSARRPITMAFKSDELFHYCMSHPFGHIKILTLP
jgi:hypothetical protein